MRTTKTLILRLLLDTHEPGALRGALRLVGEPDEHSFTDAASLLALLQRLAAPAGERRIPPGLDLRSPGKG